MTRLTVAAGPPAALPLAFLGAVPVWGIAAGLLLTAEGAGAVASRWGPATLALVHITTLGVLGNAMAGALLQFLPAAAGTRVRGGVLAGALLFVLLQAGSLALVGGFLATSPRLLTLGAACALAGFVLLALSVLPGLLSRSEALHRGLAVAVGCLLVAAILGAGLALALAGHLPGAGLLPWVDVHAMWGLLGGVMVLLATVGQVVLPMFQGVAAQQDAHQARWRMAVVATLLVGSGLIASGQPRPAALAVSACVAAWAGSLLLRQARAGRRRAGPLRAAWAFGALAMIASAVALAAGAPAPLIGALVLALALSIPVIAMLLEIVPFLGWIALQRRAPRGVRVPPVQVLLPTWVRGVTLATLAIAGVAVVVATRRPAFAPVAGLCLVSAHGILLSAIGGASLRRLRFLRGLPRP